MLRIAARETEFCLQRDIVCEPSLKAFIDCVLWRIDEIVDKLELIVISGIFNREYLLKDLIQSLISPVFRCGIQLEEVPERFQLDFEKIRILQKYF